LAGIERLSRDLEGTWTTAELQRLVEMLAEGRTFDGATIEQRIPATLTIAAGRGGNGKRLAPSTIAFVARALELKCEGLTAAKADAQVDAENHGVSSTEAVGVYRKRLRDRLS
jgi:hypothetical protein